MFIRKSAFVVALAFASFATAQYSITDLGVLSGGNSSYAYDINEAGHVVGFSTSSDGSRAFVWDSVNGMQNLGTLRNDPSSFALGINDGNKVAGYSGSGAMRTGFDWTQPTGLHDLGTFGSDSISLGIDINNDGNVVGVSGDDGGVKRAFLYDPLLGMSDLGTLAGKTGAFARGINSTTQVVGHTTGSDMSAFLWDGSMSALANMTGGTTSAAFSINTTGSAVGWATDATGEKHAVLWQSGRINPQPIDGSFSHWDGSEALDINDLGQIVGYGTFEGVAEAYLYDPNVGTTALSEVLGAAGADWEFQKAQGINENGSIVGYGLINGEVHGFIAAPVPEPASCLVLLTGTALMGLRKRRSQKKL